MRAYIDTTAFVAIGGVFVISVALVTGVDPLIQLQTEATGLTELLSILSDIVAPLLSAVIAILVWLHKRIKRLERGQAQLNTSMYGEEKDSLNEGVTKTLQDLRDAVEKMNRKIEEDEK